MQTETPRELWELRGAYGRLCSLAAYAMHEHCWGRGAIAVAMAGNGGHPAIEMVRVRMQSRRLANVLRKAEKKVPRDRLLAVMREAHLAVEAEWGVDLPAPGAKT